MVSWSLPVVLATCFVLAHLHLTEHGVREGLHQLLNFWSSHPSRLSNADLRVEKELHKIRIRNYRRAIKFTVHFACLVAVGTYLKFLHEPNLYTGMELLMPCIGWCVDMSFYRDLVPSTSRNVRMAITLNLILATGAMIFSSPQSHEEFAALEIQHLAANLLASMVFFDWLATVPFCGIAIMVAVCKQALSPLGADFFGATALVEKAAGHLLVAITAYVMEQSVRARIMADLASVDSSRLLSSFESVLKGVCDGEVLLDKDCKVVGRTECLERLLALPPEELAFKSFPDLFQDEDSHKKFSQFLDSTADEVHNDAFPVPAGLRVGLRTSNGLRCSVDLFHVLVPNVFQDDVQVHHLIALKEDVESRMRREEPDASACDVIKHWHSHQDAQDAASSEGDTLEVYEELKCMTFLVNPEKLGDIEEVHLKFQRETSEPTMRLGMPTLKRFAAPMEWDFLRRSLKSYLKSTLHEKGPPESMLLGPLLLRLPGEARSYLQAKHVSLSLASAHGPPRFWLLLKDFNQTHVQKLRTPAHELDAIQEDGSHRLKATLETELD